MRWTSYQWAVMAMLMLIVSLLLTSDDSPLAGFVAGAVALGFGIAGWRASVRERDVE